MRTFLNCAVSVRQAEGAAGPRNSFGPNVSCRRAASLTDSPELLVANARRTMSTGCACQKESAVVGTCGMPLAVRPVPRRCCLLNAPSSRYSYGSTLLICASGPPPTLGRDTRL